MGSFETRPSLTSDVILRPSTTLACSPIPVKDAGNCVELKMPLYNIKRFAVTLIVDADLFEKYSEIVKVTVVLF